MPVRITVALQAARATAVPPRQTGPAVYAAFLKAVCAAQPDLSAALHDVSRYKPFTLTPLLDVSDRPPTQPGGAARFEVGLLADELTGPVLAALTECGDYRIGTTKYRSIDVSIMSVDPFEELARQAEPRAEWGFELLTPVSFATAKDEGPRRQRPWPDPVRVLRNLADRWDAYAEVGVPPATRDVVGRHAEVSAGTLRLVDYLVEPGRNGGSPGYRTGSVGVVRYRLATAESVSPTVRRAVDALTAFADYAGFGDRTAMGMGYVRRALTGRGSRRADRPRR